MVTIASENPLSSSAGHGNSAQCFQGRVVWSTDKAEMEAAVCRQRGSAGGAGGKLRSVLGGLMVSALFFSVSKARKAHGHFLVNSKAVMRDRLDHWTLRDGVRVPVLARMTVCVDVRVLTPGEWMAFSYTSRRWWSYDLALQGDDRALYVWFLGVRRRVRVHLSLLSWHRLCLQCDSLRDSFSLEVNGSIGATETTVMARAMPAGGDLLLGWPPWEAPPGGRLAGVELYMFRMWGDVRPHAPCEDGTVAGWDSRLWSVSRPRAMARDDTLQCGEWAAPLDRQAHGPITVKMETDMPKLLVHARIKRSNVSLGTGANTTSAATVNGRAPSTSSSLPTPAAPTTTTPPPTASTPPFTPVSSTVTISDLTSSAPTSHSGANSRAVQPASSLLAQATGFLQAVASSALSTESAVVVKCDFSQFCDSTTSHYWMVVSVEVLPGNRKTVQDVQAWFSDVFSECGLSETPTPDAYSNETSGTSAAPGSCQNNSTGKSQIIKVDCEVKEDFTKTNCTVLVGRSQETDTCSISQLLQESRDHSLSAQLLGNVRRVGLDPCLDDLVLPPGDGFVHCNSSVPYQDVCVAEAPINITCSYQKSFLPQGLADGSVPSCNGQEQQYCHCDAFCQDPGAFYAFNLNIIKPDATFSDITNIITQLDSPCNSTIVPQSLCNNISTVFNCYQGVHIQCYGNGTRLYNCMVALQLNQPMDTCTVSRALVPLLSPRSSVSYDGVLTRIALCGSRKISVADLFNSTFTWVRADLGAQQICQHSNFLDFREFT
ncbi:hypothetical protein P4O66_004824 [Electrophorus voltai]|uniref:Uncharacterized protein n=1 Tax=Electrophorus voltai TaxID=2609070 RepID=A0AAD8ZXG2_9TELE|nr:hypothetical protein P4O66_004824 [Electrophorus voltai]